MKHTIKQFDNFLEKILFKMFHICILKILIQMDKIYLKFDQLETLFEFDDLSL